MAQPVKMQLASSLKMQTMTNFIFFYIAWGKLYENDFDFQSYWLQTMLFCVKRSVNNNTEKVFSNPPIFHIWEVGN